MKKLIWDIKDNNDSFVEKIMQFEDFKIYAVEQNDTRTIFAFDKLRNAHVPILDDFKAFGTYLHANSLLKVNRKLKSTDENDKPTIMEFDFYPTSSQMKVWYEQLYMRRNLRNVYRDNKTTTYVNLKNGYVEVQRKEVKFHQYSDLESHFTTYSIPLNLRLNEDITPNRNTYLWNFFYTIANKDEKLANYIIDSLATVFMLNSEYSAYFYFYGPLAANGKSTLYDLVVKTFNERHVSTLDPAKFSNRFDTNQMENKLINWTPEATNFKMSDLAILKGVTSGDPIPVERKLKQSYNAILMISIFVNSNNLPQAKGDVNDNGNDRRRIIIPMDAKVRDIKIQGWEFDKEKLFTDENYEILISTLFNRANKILNLGAYDYYRINQPQVVQEAIKSTEDNAQAAVLFFRDVINELWTESKTKQLTFSGKNIQSTDCVFFKDFRENNYKLFMDSVYQLYLEWCRRDNRHPQGKETLINNLHNKGIIFKNIKGKRYSLTPNEYSQIKAVATSGTNMHDTSYVKQVHNADLDRVLQYTSTMKRTENLVVMNLEHEIWKEYKDE